MKEIRDTFDSLDFNSCGQIRADTLTSAYESYGAQDQGDDGDIAMKFKEVIMNLNSSGGIHADYLNYKQFITSTLSGEFLTLKNL